MRYIYYILFILTVITGIIGYELMTMSAPPRNAALIINKKVITVDECDRLMSSFPKHFGGKDDCINSIVTKELLIQESQREGIDKEEAFRKSIQNFYEQSLIKLLMDRKFASLKITVSDVELNRYMEALDRKFHITTFRFNDLEKAKAGRYTNGESRAVHFEDLSKDIRGRLILLKEGQVTEPVKTGGGYIVMRLDKTEKLSSERHSDEERNSIRKKLEEDKKEEKINEWIADLKKKATITNLLKADN